MKVKIKAWYVSLFPGYKIEHFNLEVLGDCEFDVDPDQDLDIQIAKHTIPWSQVRAFNAPAPLSAHYITYLKKTDPTICVLEPGEFSAYKAAQELLVQGYVNWDGDSAVIVEIIEIKKEEIKKDECKHSSEWRMVGSLRNRWI